MNKINTRTYHHGDLRAAMVRAGREILETEDRQALTLRACARRAGVSHAAPQYHFANVSKLLGEIAATGFVDFVAALDAAADEFSDPSARLVAMGLRYFQFSREHPALYKVMVAGSEPSDTPESLRAARHAAWNQLFDAVQKVKSGQNVETGAMLVWSLVHGFSMLAGSLAMPPIRDWERDLRPMLEVAVAGLANLR